VAELDHALRARAQRGQKRFQQAEVEPQRWRKLKENRAQPALQAPDPLKEKGDIPVHVD